MNDTKNFHSYTILRILELKQTTPPKVAERKYWRVKKYHPDEHANGTIRYHAIYLSLPRIRNKKYHNGIC